jgi:hypothetical protein
MKQTTTARGYGYQHQQLRNKWQTIVDQGHAYCHATICLQPSRHIPPGTPWDLGHTTDRTAWTGPEHPLCNRSEGGRRARQQHKPTAWQPQRRW